MCVTGDTFSWYIYWRSLNWRDCGSFMGTGSCWFFHLLNLAWKFRFNSWWKVQEFLIDKMNFGTYYVNLGFEKTASKDQQPSLWLKIVCNIHCNQGSSNEVSYYFINIPFLKLILAPIHLCKNVIVSGRCLIDLIYSSTHFPEYDIGLANLGSVSDFGRRVYLRRQPT